MEVMLLFEFYRFFFILMKRESDHKALDLLVNNADRNKCPPHKELKIKPQFFCVRRSQVVVWLPDEDAATHAVYYNNYLVSRRPWVRSLKIGCPAQMAK